MLREIADEMENNAIVHGFLKNKLTVAQKEDLIKQLENIQKQEGRNLTLRDVNMLYDVTHID